MKSFDLNAVAALADRLVAHGLLQESSAEIHTIRALVRGASSRSVEAVALFDDPSMLGVSLRGWAESSGCSTVCLRANGESSYLSPDDARRLAAQLLAAANGMLP